MKHPRILALALCANMLIGPLTQPAYADNETWSWLEVRLPVSDGAMGLPHSLRLWTDVRYGGRFDGLGQLFFRAGPIWELHPNLMLALHGTTYADQAIPGVFEQEQRLEAEPNLRGRLGDFTWNDRNRFEARFRATGLRWRYRNQLRVNYEIPGTAFVPFAWDEVLIDLSGLGFNQNRAALGIGARLSDATRVDLAYLLRSRATTAGAWEQDHVLNLTLFFAPKVEPLIRPEPVFRRHPRVSAEPGLLDD